MAEEISQVIVGLGNPGLAYARHRHNVGFMVLDLLARRLGLDFSGETGTWQAAGGRQLRLIKPLGYMNCSGEALVAWSAATGVPLTGQPAQMPMAAAGPDSDSTEPPAMEPVDPPGVRPLVICDDLALPLGAVRLRARGRSGGQNGLASIIEHLGGEEVPRMRLGIAPTTGAVPPEEWADFVLADFRDEETGPAAEMVGHAVSALEFWLTEGLAATVSRFNRRAGPVV